ncbi:hypothetical protein BH24ACT7_BH24ACT7_06170 [soil metagenome]
MSNELARRVSDTVGLAVSAASGRLPRPVVQAVDGAAHRGLVAAARTQAAAYVTHVAVNQVVSLSREEALLVATVPADDPIQREQVAARLRVMVDNFTVVAAAEIARLGH